MHPYFLEGLVAQHRAQLEREAESERLLGQAPRRPGEGYPSRGPQRPASRRTTRRTARRSRTARRLLRRARRDRR